MSLKKFVLCVSVLSSFALISCTKETVREIEKVPEAKQAPGDINESFKKAELKDCAQASCVTIKKSSLGKVFLLLASGKRRVQHLSGTI